MSFKIPDCRYASVLQQPIRIFQKGNLFDEKAKIKCNISTTFPVRLVRLGEHAWRLS